MRSPSLGSTCAVNLEQCDRWIAYQRLQELDIPCTCRCGQPLQVNLENAVALVQLWSVVRRIESSRHDLAQWLNHCLLAS
ncbi:hypothetical protein Pse7367_0649 [Thalassoporum mexicanum PCC 7367]|uniref:Asr1405/Asl0597 family protein n=1 Tax=Thalassoporum mexicanum TaxID=3457544 RepID=UPI00029FCA8A|nr:hypothetical protein Pse7367_0649 [Pseudanabaena sp. PCC 7367]